MSGRRCRGDAGSVTGAWILFAPFLLLVVAVLFEGGQTLAARREASNLALQAARSAGQEVDEAAVRSGPPRLDAQAAEAAARTFVGGRAGSVEVRVSGDVVTVTVTIEHPTPMLGMIGMSTRTVSATESARAVRGGRGGN
jgi:Flp pilus assembly protein TadG